MDINDRGYMLSLGQMDKPYLSTAYRQIENINKTLRCITASTHYTSHLQHIS